MKHVPHALAFAALATTLTVSAADWPNWRGAQRNDHSPDKGLLKQWPAEGPRQLWVFKDAGLGYAGYSIVGGQLFTMGLRGDMESLIALDANTGKELWATEMGPLLKNDWGNGPRGTPTVDGGKVFAMSGQGYLICADARTGKELWKVKMSQFGGTTPKWGFTESPLIDGNQVICTPGGPQGTLLALDKASGKKLWQSADWTDEAQYSSPIVIEHNSARQYVQLTMKHVTGVGTDGKVIWKSPWNGQTAVIPTPIFKDGHVYIASGYGIGCKLVKIGADNQVSDVYANTTMVNHHGGVILVGDHLYGFSEAGKVWVCQDFKTGAEVWSSKNLGKGAIHYADGMLYCLDESTGTLALIEASPKGWNEKGRFKLAPQTTLRTPKGRVWTHPVVINGKLYLRDQELLHCYDVKGT